MSNIQDQMCSHCGIPLRAVMGWTDDGRCRDKKACQARRDLALGKYSFSLRDPVDLAPGLWLISPEGAVKLEPNPLSED